MSRNNVFLSYSVSLKTLYMIGSGVFELTSQRAELGAALTKKLFSLNSNEPLLSDGNDLGTS